MYHVLSTSSLRRYPGHRVIEFPDIDINRNVLTPPHMQQFKLLISETARHRVSPLPPVLFSLLLACPSCLLCWTSVYCLMPQDEHLEWMSDGQELWNSIVGLQPTILTGLPMGKWAEPQKVRRFTRSIIFFVVARS